MHALEREIDCRFVMVRLDRIRERVRRRLIATLMERREMKFPNLSAVADEIGKLGAELEDDARKVITEAIPAIRAHKARTFEGVSRHLGDAKGALVTMDGMLDALDKATNGGPTLGDSSQSPASAQPSETASLHEVK